MIEMTHTKWMASCALAVSLALGGVALARDRDDDYDRERNADQTRQHGYRNGSPYRSSENWGDRDGDRDDRWPSRGWRGGHDDAYRFGYDDGSVAARSDIELGKSYNSKPRGRYGDRDHGYRRGYGSKNEYKAEYTSGYRAGYDAAMRRRY